MFDWSSLTQRESRAVGVAMAVLGCMVECPGSVLIRLAEVEQGLGCCTGYKYAVKAVVMSVGLTLSLGGPRAFIADCRQIGRYFFLAAFCEGALCFFWNLAVMLTSAANAAALQMLNPTWCIIFTFFLTWERTPNYTLVASIITFSCGVAIFVMSLNSHRGVESILGDLFGILTGMSIGLYLTVLGHVQKVYPGVNPMGVIALGGAFASVSSFMLVEGNILQECYPESGIPGYTWSITDGVLTTTSLFLISLSTKRLPSAVTGLLFLTTSIVQPYIVWIVLDERPLDSTLVFGAILCITLVVHEMVGFYYADEKLRDN